MTFSFVEIIGATGATLTTLCWVPQAVKIIREQDTRAISLPATAAFTFGMLLWFCYGVALKDMPLIMSSAIELVLMTVIVGLKLRLG